MALQTLPSSARKYSTAQLAAIDATLKRVEAQWRRMGTRFDAGWELVGPSIIAEMLDSQHELAQRATEYIPAVLKETGQDAVAAAETNVDAFVGVTGAGFPVGESLSTATIRAKQAVAGGATPIQALVSAGSWLQMASTTILADTMRGAEAVGRYNHNVGYVRMVHGKGCGRCVILAGKWFRTNQGFLRHPRCKCTHIPAAEDVAGDWQTHPHTYFHSLNPEQQIKLMGSKANAQAVLDGADIGRVVNAYRNTAGMSFAQVSPIKIRNGAKFTTEATSRRAIAAQQQVGLRRSGQAQIRLMPESIATIAKDAGDRMRLLKLYGWVDDAEGLAKGRTILAEQRRVERNARQRERRAGAPSVGKTPATAAGGGAGAGKPPSTPASGAASDPDRGDKAGWKARQDALPVDFKGETLEPHEVKFVERFLASGHQLEWIAKDVRHRPVNDFVWTSNGHLVMELKSTKARFTTIRGRIEDAVRKAEAQNVVKSNFMIDLGDQPLTDDLRAQLAAYNAGRLKHRIHRLWVTSQSHTVEIPLTNK